MTGIKKAIRISSTSIYAFLLGNIHTSNTQADTQGLQSEHHWEFGLRPRYSTLEERSNEGKAGSVLLRGGIQSQWSETFSTQVEVDYIDTFLTNQHNDGVRFNGQPSIPDVPGTEVNQLFVEYQTAQWGGRLGRQLVTYDNQRFIGSNGFWQNDQTFDALTLSYQWLSASRLDYAYLVNANRIFGDDADSSLELSDANYGTNNGQRPAGNLGDHEHKSHLIRAEINEWDFSQWVLYGYLIDNLDAPGQTNTTAGSLYTLKIKPNTFTYRIEVEAATQTRKEIATRPSPYYARLELGVGFNSIELSVQHEVLASDDQIAFTTPLGSLHEFNGWADKFTGAPAQGLDDDRLQLTWRHAPLKFDLRYHIFSSHQGSSTFGTEIDIDIIYKPRKKHSLLLRYADFRNEDNSPIDFGDTTRIMFSYSYNI